MKITTMMVLVSNIPAIICAVFAGVLAYKGVEGWGWFILATVLLFATVSSKKGGEE